MLAAVVALLAGTAAVGLAIPGPRSTPADHTQTRLPPPRPGGDPSLGVSLAPYKGEDLDGQPVSISPGKPTVMLFVSHWCADCTKALDTLVAFARHNHTVQAIVVSQQPDPTLRNYPPAEWLADHQWTGTTVDDIAAVLFTKVGAPNVPFWVITDGQLRIKLRHFGDTSENDLQAVID